MTESPTHSPKTMAQNRAFSSQVESVAQSLRNTTDEIAAIEAAAQRLAAAGNERAALGEQVSAATEAIASSVDETAAMAQSLAKGQLTASDLSQTLLSSVEGSALSLRNV